MKPLLWFTIGATSIILTWITWKPALAWTLTHNPPTTPHGHEPRVRAWRNGEQVSDHD